MSILEPTSNPATLPVVAPPAARTGSSVFSGRRWVLIAPLVDALVLTLAVVVERLSGRAVGAESLSVVWVVGFPAVAITLLSMCGLYRHRLRLQLLDDLRTIAGATAIASMTTITLPVVLGREHGRRLCARGSSLALFDRLPDGEPRRDHLVDPRLEDLRRQSFPNADRRRGHGRPRPRETPPRTSRDRSGAYRLPRQGSPRGPRR